MSLALSSPPSSSVAGLVPATLVAGLGEGLDQTRHALRLDDEQVHPGPGGTLTAELPVPGGVWRIWPDRGQAAWLGRRQADLPRVNDATVVGLELPAAIRHLHARGLWCVEVRLLDSDGWGRPMDAYEGLSQLMRRVDEIDAVSGIFTGGETGAARVELYRDGRVLAGDRLDAERWLLVAHDLVDAC